MRIIIDTRWIRSLKIDGIANFTLNITRELLKSEHQFILITNSNEITDFLKLSLGNVKPVFYYTNCSVNSFKNVYLIPKIISKLKPDIYFSPCYPFFSPLIKGCRHVGVIHDLIPLIFPEMFKNASKKFRLFYCNKLVQKLIIKKLDTVITVSKSTKNDLINLLGINLGKINIITEGCRLEDIAEKEDLPEKFNINKEFFLFVGRHEPYKNISGLIKIYNQLPENIKNTYLLVIIGKFDQNTQILFSLVKKLNEEKRVIFIDSVMPEQLPLFYKKAKILLHLSLYEGFGLTILEAMRYGLPVIGYNVSSIPEVAGDVGILAEPGNDTDIIENIIKLIDNKELYRDLKFKGIERAKSFTWENSAKQVLEILKL